MRPTSPQKIVEAALVVFAKNPLATLDQVAEAAGMGRATLFRHFPGKKALMRELSLESNRRCMAALTPFVHDVDKASEACGTRGTHEDAPPPSAPLERFAKAVEALIPLGAAFHFLTWEPWHTDDAELESNNNNYLALWGTLLEQLRTTGAIASDLPLSWVVNTLDVLLYGAWEGIYNGDIAPKQAAALTLRTFLRGVGPE